MGFTRKIKYSNFFLYLCMSICQNSGLARFAIHEKNKKILYISQEIFPFLPESPVADMGRYLPQAMQERKKETRTFMPKFGVINERRNQLHEVIRLSGMNLIIDDTDYPLIIKVASIQSARLQVYFIDNEDFFQRKFTIYDEDGKEFIDNDERTIFFVRGVMETVKKLRWTPDVVHCLGWMTALAPLYVKRAFNQDPFFRHSKVIYSLFKDDFKQPFRDIFTEKLVLEGIESKDLVHLQGKEIDYLALSKLAIDYSDGIIQSEADTNPEILKYIKEKNKSFLPYTPDEDYADEYVKFYNSVSLTKT